MLGTTDLNGWKIQNAKLFSATVSPWPRNHLTFMAMLVAAPTHPAVIETHVYAHCSESIEIIIVLHHRSSLALALLLRTSMAGYLDMLDSLHLILAAVLQR